MAGTLRVRIVGDDANLKKTLGSAGKTALKWGAAVAAAGAAAGTAMVAAAAKTAEYGDEVAKTSTKLGIGAEALQEARFWADRNGISADALDKAVGRLNQRIGLAVDGNEKYADAFKALGVKIKDSQGDIRDTETVLGETIKALSEIEDPALQAARASEVFGVRVSRDLMPALQDGALSLEDARKKARELGLVMSTDATKAAERFADGWTNIKGSIMGTMRTAFTPLMTLMADKFFPFLEEKVLPGIVKVTQAFSEDGLAGALKEVGNIFKGGNLLEALGGFLSNILTWISNNVPKIVDFILEQREAFFNAAIKVFTALTEALPEIIPEVLNALIRMVTTLATTLVQMAPLLIQAGLQLLLGIVEAVVKVLPTLITSIVQLATTIIVTLIKALPTFISAGIRLLLALITGIVRALPTLIDSVVNAIPQIIVALIEALPQLIIAGIEILLALIEGIVETIPILVDTFITLTPKIVQALIKAMPRIIAAGEKFLPALLKGILKRWPGLAKFFVDIPVKIVQFLNRLPGMLFRVGKNILRSLWNGLRSVWADVKRWFLSIINWMAGLWPFSPADHGPLRAKPPEEWGSGVMGQLSKGIEDATPAVLKQMEGVAGAMQLAAPDLGAMVGEADADARRRLERAAAAGPAAGPQATEVTSRVVIDITGGGDDLKRMLRRMVRNEAGGSAERFFRAPT